jgi:hypothetical protein
MKITDAYVRAMADAQGLVIPEDELVNIRIRLTTWMAAMDQIEAELGERMNAADPIPPIFDDGG